MNVNDLKVSSYVLKEGEDCNGYYAYLITRRPSKKDCWVVAKCAEDRMYVLNKNKTDFMLDGPMFVYECDTPEDGINAWDEYCVNKAKCDYVRVCREWLKGCTCSHKGHPEECEECTNGFLEAVKDIGSKDGKCEMDKLAWLDTLDEYYKHKEEETHED